MDPVQQMRDLKNTGERVIEKYSADGPENRLMYISHVAAYKHCLSFTEGKKVLDFGCGSGYGTAFLSEKCSSVTGVDVSEDAIAFAQQEYRRENLEFIHIDSEGKDRLPFRDNEIDVVLMLQVIEHLREPSFTMAEIKRVLVADGLCIIATPDRDCRLFSFQRPWNKYHYKEYSAESLSQLLRPFFSSIEILNMSATEEIFRFELERVRTRKWLTLPWTLPFMPEWWRVAGLAMIKTAYCSLGRLLHTEGDHDFSQWNENSFLMARSLSRSINLISHAKNNEE